MQLPLSPQASVPCTCTYVSAPRQPARRAPELLPCVHERGSDNRANQNCELPDPGSARRLTAAMHCAMRDRPPSGRRRLLNFVSGRSGWQQAIRWYASSGGRRLGAKAELVHCTTTPRLSGLCAVGVTREHVAGHLLCSRGRWTSQWRVWLVRVRAPHPLGRTFRLDHKLSHTVVRIHMAEEPTFTQLSERSLLGFGKGKGHMRNDRAHKA